MGGPTIRGRAKGQTDSISRNTNIFGIMGGRPIVTGMSVSNRTAIKNRAWGQSIPTAPGPGRAFMLTRGLLSVNPQSSGGVGRRQPSNVQFRW